MTVHKPSTNGLLCVSVSELTNVSASWAGERRTCWSRLKVSVSRTNCETESSAVDGYRSRLTSQPLKQKQNYITDHTTSHRTLSSWHHFLQTQSEALKERRDTLRVLKWNFLNLKMIFSQLLWEKKLFKLIWGKIRICFKVNFTQTCDSPGALVRSSLCQIWSSMPQLQMW